MSFWDAPHILQNDVVEAIWIRFWPMQWHAVGSRWYRQAMLPLPRRVWKHFSDPRETREARFGVQTTASASSDCATTLPWWKDDTKLNQRILPKRSCRPAHPTIVWPWWLLSVHVRSRAGPARGILNDFFPDGRRFNPNVSEQKLNVTYFSETFCKGSNQNLNHSSFQSCTVILTKTISKYWQGIWENINNSNSTKCKKSEENTCSRLQKRKIHCICYSIK